MDRAEQAGLGVAVAGHILVFGALSLALVAPRTPPVTTPPVDIQIVDEVALKDRAPQPSPVAPAPSVAPEVGPPVEAVASPEPQAPPPPKPVPTPVTPKVIAKIATPKPTAKPAPTKPAPAKPIVARSILAPVAPAKPTPRGARLGSDFLKGIADRPTTSASQAPRAPAGPAVTASLAREVLRQLKPHWKAPTGADAELLRTELSIALDPDGRVTDVRVLRTTGQTDSNRAQVKLHQEAAMKAVKLASPFTLPPELYSAWKLLEPVGFDKRLG